MSPLEKKYDEVISKGQAMKAFIDAHLGKQISSKHPNVHEKDRAILDLSAEMYEYCIEAIPRWNPSNIS